MRNVETRDAECKEAAKRLWGLVSIIIRFQNKMGRLTLFAMSRFVPMRPAVQLFSGSARFLAACAVVAFVCAAPAPAVEWIAPAPEELAATASTIDPEAGAEILYRFKQIDDSEYMAPVTEEYIRIKVFNEKGVRQLDKIEVPRERGERIANLQARVVKKNGTILNVDKKSFYERDVLKYDEVKVRVRSFSFPQLEPGDIAEYKWSIIGNDNVLAARFYFLQDKPTRHAIFRVKPAPLVTGYATKGFFYKCHEQKTQVSPDGFTFIEMKDLPAFVDEPCMEPEQDAQPWMLFYPAKTSQKPAAFWEEVANEARTRSERHAKKPSKLVVETAKRIAASAAGTEEKLARINDYCRANIVNYWVYAPRGGVDEKIRAKRDRTPDELIKTKLGNSDDIPVLFVALARALDIDARVALCANRSDGAFKMNLTMPYYLNEVFVAVKVGETWRLYDPAHDLVSTGMLRWRNEGVPAMVVLPKGVEWIVTGRTPAVQSVTKRTANLRLNDEGTLLGDIRIEYSGQSEIVARYRYQNETEQKIEELVRESLRASQPGAEVSNVRATNGDGVLKPLVLTYSVTIPGYAESAGQRFFIQPGFFTKGQGALFTESERRHNLFFSHGETCKDDVTIRLPSGFRLEEGSAPPGIEAGPWGHYKLTIAMKKSDNSIIYKRDFAFSMLACPAAGYKAVKLLFDAVHNRDSHALTFRVGG